MKWTIVAIVVGSAACSKSSPSVVPWAEQPTKIIRGTVERRNLPPLTWHITAPEEMTEATGDTPIGKLSSPALRFFHVATQPGVSVSLDGCDGLPGDDPTISWRTMYSTAVQPTADGFEHVQPTSDRSPAFAVDVIHVKSGAGLCCHATDLYDEMTDRQTTALRAICASAKIE